MKRAKKLVIAAVSVCFLLCLTVAIVGASDTIVKAYASSAQENYISEGAPIADKADGEYNGNLTVALSSSLADAEIYYTLDGTVPTAENGIKYTSPINLTPRRSEYVIRAVATSGGGRL